MATVSRRTFLLGGSAALVLAACSGDGAPDDGAAPTPAPPTSPPGSTGSAGGAAPPPTTTVAAYAGTTDPFTLGVASGDPAADSVVLWTRLLPAGEALAGDVALSVELAADPGFTSVVATYPAVASPDDGHAVHVLATGLAPDAWYAYRFHAGAFTSPVGRTRTTPAVAASPATFVFASASCQNYEHGYYVAHRDIAGAGLDAVVWLGDYIYEGPGHPVGGDDVRTHGAPEATTLEGYRDRYALYKADPDLQAAHAACPWLVVWDDHEVANNYAGDAYGDASAPDAFRARRAAAYRAWWEHMPVRLERPGDADVRIYRSFRYGDLVDMSLLDTRQYRADQTCGDVPLDLGPPCPETFDAARTMLGAEQEAWLDQRLAAPAGRWTVLAQQVVLANATLNGAVLNYDQWDGYPVARERLLQTVADAQVANLVVLTGDVHLAACGHLRAPGGGPIIGSELVATAISSRGLIDPALQSTLAAIPDFVDAELVHRGWIKHTATRETWQAEYRIVDDARRPDSGVGSYATFALTAGTPGLTRAG